MKPLPFCTVLLAATVVVETTQAQTTFTVRRVADDSVAFSGDLSPEMTDVTTSIPVRLADFTRLTEPGNYYVEAPGFGRSVAFRIGADAYDSQLVSLMLGYYGWRSGIDINFDHHGTHFGHLAGHLDDAWLDYAGQPGVQQDGTGGWYDAGDYGKYIPTAAQAAGTLLAAWELFSDQLSAVSLPFIPEHGGTLPDYLAEVKWELDWMLKMVYADQSGRVYHQISTKSYPGLTGVAPVDDVDTPGYDSTRFYTTYSTTATADFAATMAKAARIYRLYDAAYADRLLAAAELSYDYLVANPDYVNTDKSVVRCGTYQSSDEDDRAWAAAEIWETTGDQAALADLETRVGGSTLGLATTADWDKLQNFGIIVYLLSQRPGRDPTVVARLETQLDDIVSSLAAHREESGYGRALLGFSWDSNGILARTCMFLQTKNVLAPDPSYLDLCAEQIGFLYGRNQYNRSQVTGEGIHPPAQPHHRPSAADAVDAPYPGLLVGGGDSATNWQDLQGSARTNEVAINYNSALVFALAGFVQGASSSESVGAVAPEDCGVRVSSIGYLPDRSKVATLTTQCDFPSAFQCVTRPETFGGDTGGPPSMIDDLEDGDTSILMQDGRQGLWYSYDDRRGHPEFAVQPAQREGSQNAICTSGGGYQSWGGYIRAELNQVSTNRRLYDASAYTGVTFWARGSSNPFQVILVDEYNDRLGGVCASCDDNFQKSFTPSSQWQKFTFVWNDFTQLGFGQAWPNTCPAALYSVQFQWPPNTDYELCLDDIAFTSPSPAAADAGQGGQGGQAGVPPLPELTPSGGGCDCRLGRAPGSRLWLVLLLAAAAGVRRRRARLPAGSFPGPSRRRSAPRADRAPAPPRDPSGAPRDR